MPHILSIITIIIIIDIDIGIGMGSISHIDRILIIIVLL